MQKKFFPHIIFLVLILSIIAFQISVYIIRDLPITLFQDHNIGDYEFSGRPHNGFENDTMNPTPIATVPLVVDSSGDRVVAPSPTPIVTPTSWPTRPPKFLSGTLDTGSTLDDKDFFKKMEPADGVTVPYGVVKFLWTNNPVPGRNYEIHFYTYDGLEPALDILSISGNENQIDLRQVSGLQPGETYTWQVTTNAGLIVADKYRNTYIKRKFTIENISDFEKKVSNTPNPPATLSPVQQTPFPDELIRMESVDTRRGLDGRLLPDDFFQKKAPQNGMEVVYGPVDFVWAKNPNPNTGYIFEFYEDGGSLSNIYQRYFDGNSITLDLTKIPALKSGKLYRWQVFSQNTPNNQLNADGSEQWRFWIMK